MDNRKAVGGSSSSSSSSLDHLFGPKDSSSGVLGSIFPPPPTAYGRDSGFMGSHYQGGNGKYGNPAPIVGEKRGENRGATRSSGYPTETSEPCNFSSSISYGGQENYSGKKKTEESSQFKKNGGEDDPNGSNSNGASRGNWWQGSLYY